MTKRRGRYAVAAAFLLMSVPVAVRAQEDAVAEVTPLTLQAGEIRLRGVIRAAATSGSAFEMVVEAVTEPGKETARLSVPRVKLVHILLGGTLLRRGDLAREATIADLQPGVEALVIGMNSGAGAPLSARLVLLGGRSSIPYLPSAGNSAVAPVRRTDLDPDGVSHQKVVVPMVFPVLGPVRWSDTFLNPRDGGARRHHGQDLPAPKMRPLLACFDGVVYCGGGSLSLLGDNGWTATYIHLNNDHPGTDDAAGGPEYCYAPGLKSGMRVVAGQFIGYCGDSGNAEGTIPHLHFEIRKGSAVYNAAPSLKAAQRLTAPRLKLPAPQLTPAPGEIRLDGVVRGYDETRGVLTLSPSAYTVTKGKATHTTVVTKPERRYFRLKPGETRVGAITLVASAASPALSEPTPAEALRPGASVVLIAQQSKKASAALNVHRVVLNEPPPAPLPAPVQHTAREQTPQGYEGSLPPVGDSVFVTTRTVPALPSAPDEVVSRVVELVNFYRKERGLPEVRRNTRLCRAAQAHSVDMAERGFYGHRGTGNTTLADRVTRAGYAAGAVFENLGAGVDGPDKLLAGWMLRGGEEKRYLLDARLTEVGVGYYYRPDDPSPIRARHYWTVIFAAPLLPPGAE